MNLRTYQMKSKHLFKMAMDRGLYVQVVMICRRESYDKKETKNIKKYNFQGKSARSRRWFNIDYQWLKEKFRTLEPYFYRKLYQTKFRGDDTKTYQIFGVIIGNAKITRKVQFHPAAPVIKYHQKTSTICCWSSLSSAFNCIGNNISVPALVNIVEKSSTLQSELF